MAIVQEVINNLDIVQEVMKNIAIESRICGHCAEELPKKTLIVLYVYIM